MIRNYILNSETKFSLEEYLGITSLGNFSENIDNL